MDILAVLIVFFLLATIVKIATDNAAKLLKPFKDITKYKLVVAFILTTTGVFGLNQGVLEVLNVPLEVSRSWFHYFDLILTSLFLTGGAQAIHKLADAWSEYKTKYKDKYSIELKDVDIEKLSESINKIAKDENKYI